MKKNYIGELIIELSEVFKTVRIFLHQLKYCVNM